MARIDEVEYNGMKIVPLQFLKAVLTNPQDPVSYTHLDVYKRQPSNTATQEFVVPKSIPIIFPMIVIFLFVIILFRRPPCLLYTSKKKR